MLAIAPIMTPLYWKMAIADKKQVLEMTVFNKKTPDHKLYQVIHSCKLR